MFVGDRTPHRGSARGRGRGRVRGRVGVRVRSFLLETKSHTRIRTRECGSVGALGLGLWLGLGLRRLLLTSQSISFTTTVMVCEYYSKGCLGSGDGTEG